MRRHLLTLGAVLVSGLALASDAPHDMSSAPSIDCNSCHTLHVGGVGTAITNAVGNYNLCKSCHDSRAGLAWPEGYQAVPGSQGRSHRWDAPAVSGQFGASTPVDAEVLRHLSSGSLQCSTCHEPHTGGSQHGGRQRTSVAVGVPVTRTSGGGTGTLVLNQPAAASAAKGYRLEVVTAGALGVSTFRVSNDNGASWFGWSGAWVAGAATGRPTGANLTLNDGANVTVTFAGSFAVGDRWDFQVTYPLLQMPMTSSELCETCHQSRVQSAAYNESGGDGVKVFSHPVGEGLAKPYDRAPAALLDTDGQTQAVGDAIRTNDLKLAPGDQVRCLTCHNVHHADSNSLTEDER